jgi:transposase
LIRRFPRFIGTPPVSSGTREGFDRHKTVTPHATTSPHELPVRSIRFRTCLQFELWRTAWLSIAGQTRLANTRHFDVSWSSLAAFRGSLNRIQTSICGVRHLSL